MCDTGTFNKALGKLSELYDNTKIQQKALGKALGKEGRIL